VSVYLDPLMYHGWLMYGRAVKSCHMFADTLEELYAMGEKIGLKRSHLQGLGTKGREPHFDLVASKRSEAIAAGAIEATREQSVALWRKHREENFNPERKAKP
jgi:hypothetical protein